MGTKVCVLSVRLLVRYLQGMSFWSEWHVYMSVRMCCGSNITYSEVSPPTKHGHLLNLLATPVTLCKEWQSGSNIQRGGSYIQRGGNHQHLLIPYNFLQPWSPP